MRYINPRFYITLYIQQHVSTTVGSVTTTVTNAMLSLKVFFFKLVGIKQNYDKSKAAHLVTHSGSLMAHISADRQRERERERVYLPST